MVGPAPDFVSVRDRIAIQGICELKAERIVEPINSIEGRGCHSEVAGVGRTQIADGPAQLVGIRFSPFLKPSLVCDCLFPAVRTPRDRFDAEGAEVRRQESGCRFWGISESAPSRQ